ncbi:unnamed protein product, partial [Cyprideis torosa]
MYRRAQKGIGYLAQEASVFRKLSVEQNIMGVLEMTKLSKKEQKHKCNELIEEFGLEHIRDSRGDLLSGGERRRTEIARCLAVSPNFILLDEPFAGVDPIAVEDIQKVVRSLKEKNIGILITDHNVQQTLAITDKTYIMFEGRIFKEGSPEDLASDPEERLKRLEIERQERAQAEQERIRREQRLAAENAAREEALRQEAERKKQEEIARAEAKRKEQERREAELAKQLKEQERLKTLEKERKIAAEKAEREEALRQEAE